MRPEERGGSGQQLPCERQDLVADVGAAQDRKLLERVVQARISHKAEAIHWLPDSQFGFRPGRSTVDVLVRVQQRAHSAFERGECMLVESLDIRGAFDSVSHDLLLQRLRRLRVGVMMFR